jgi:regulator of replication initiation timing
MAKTLTRSVDLEPIDRLEEKIKLLVAVIERLRNEQTQLADENARLTRTLETLESRMAEAEGVNVELTSLREERDLVRGRVAEMLEQLEALDL